MGNLYEVKRDGKKIGEFSSNQLRTMATEGQLLEDDLIRQVNSDSRWKNASSVKSFNFKNKESETISIEIEEDGAEEFRARSVTAASQFTEAISLQKHHLPEKMRELIHSNEKILYASRPSKTALIINMIVFGVLFAIPTLGLSLLFTYLSWKNTYYVITKGRTIVMQGIFNVAVKILMNDNIQLISINTGIVDRWLGLNTVELSTAAQGGGVNFFPGMSTGCVTLKQVETTDVIHHYAQPAQL